MVSIDIVSPHRDDAALSLSETLGRLTVAGCQFRILSCFTISAWAPRLDGPLTVQQVSDLRRREDEAFVALYSSAGEVCGLDFMDGPLRPDWVIQGRESVQKAYGPESVLVQKVTDSLREFRRPDSILAVPLAVGHRDHLVCLWAGLAVASDAPLLIYEDVPYSLQISLDELAAQVADLGKMLNRSFCPVYFAETFSACRWSQRMSCYRSQFSSEELATLVHQIEARGGERCWIDPQASQVLTALLKA